MSVPTPANRVARAGFCFAGQRLRRAFSFILHRLPWYLAVEPRRDVIELPISDELDGRMGAA